MLSLRFSCQRLHVKDTRSIAETSRVLLSSVKKRSLKLSTTHLSAVPDWASVSCAIDVMAQEARYEGSRQLPKVESFSSLVRRMESVVRRAKAQAARAEQMKRTAQKMRDQAISMASVACRPILP